MRLGLHEVTVSKNCYDVSSAGSGKILICGDNGCNEVDSTGVLRRVINPPDDEVVLSMQRYEHQIYTLRAASGSGSRRFVKVYDSQYNPVDRWSVPDDSRTSTIAVISGRVFVADPESKQIVVYTTDGIVLAPIKHTTFKRPRCLGICPPHHLLVSDLFSSTVYKVDLREDEYRFRWISDKVTNPDGICWYNNDVWVWSNQSKSVVVLSDAGKLKEKLEHPKLHECSGRISGLYIRDDVMWAAAHSDGLIKFPIKY